MIVRTLLFFKTLSTFLSICRNEGATSDKSFSALLLGGLGGTAVFKTNQLKVHIFCEGNKNLKKKSQFYVTVLSKFKNSCEIFQSFVTFLEYINLKKTVMIRGDVITAFKIGKLFGLSFIITGATP